MDPVMRVRERTPCEFFAQQMSEAGRMATDVGVVRWVAGDWLLADRAGMDPERVCSSERFTEEYEAIDNDE